MEIILVVAFGRKMVKINRKRVSGVMLMPLVVGTLTLVFNIQPVKAEPSTIIVPDDYEKIQWAIDNAAAGDTIFVRAGTYNETVVIEKRITLLGENKETTVIVGAWIASVWQPAIFVRADDVMIANFTVTNGGHGILLQSFKRSTVTDCIAYGNGFGLTISSSSHNFLRRNLIFDNNHNLLVLGPWWSIDDFIQDIDTSNYVNGKPVYYLVNQENLSINLTTFPDIGYLAVVNSTNVQITDLNLSRNGNGVLVAFSPNTLIENVEATYNSRGICITSSSETTVKHCNVSYNDLGIFSYASDNVTFKENNILRNSRGIFLMCSLWNSMHIYHNNFIENYEYGQARVHMSYTCNWNCSYPFGGNYWSDYNGKDYCQGPYQNETGSDGIGDTPYVIDENNRDNYPLMNPLTLTPPVERKVGVRKGHYVTYDLKYTYSTNDPNPPIPAFEETQFQVNVTVLQIINTTITCEQTQYYENGENETNIFTIDVETGKEAFLTFISANLSEGDSIYSGVELKINETVTRSYLRTSRTVNHLETITIRYYYEYNETRKDDVYWDRTTGALVEWSGQIAYIDEANNYTTVLSFSYKIVETNLWEFILAGDANSDGVVNVFDGVIIGTAWDSRPGDQNWDPRADLKEDGWINLYDIVIWGEHFGEAI
jgi:parallel beta-helix repeat protein